MTYTVSKRGSDAEDEGQPLVVIMWGAPSKPGTCQIFWKWHFSSHFTILFNNANIINKCSSEPEICWF